MKKAFSSIASLDHLDESDKAQYNKLCILTLSKLQCPVIERSLFKQSLEKLGALFTNPSILFTNNDESQQPQINLDDTICSPLGNDLATMELL